MDDTDPALQAVVEAHPELNAFGFGVFAPHRLTPQQRAAALARGRADLGADIEGFRRARAWLAGQARTKNVNPHAGTTYGLKHTAEKTVGYLTNGAFIAAALAEGFTVQRIDGGPNGWLNIGSRHAHPPGGPSRNPADGRRE